MTGTPAGMQSKTKSPVLLTDAAAVSGGQITKRPGSNGGSVALFLAPLVGIQSAGDPGHRRGRRGRSPAL